MPLGDMSAISPYKIMNYRLKIQDDFNSFYKKYYAALSEAMRSIKKGEHRQIECRCSPLIIISSDKLSCRSASCYLSIALTSVATVVPL